MTVPGFGLSKVQVVDTVKIHVLSVPSKCTLPHPKVQIWCVHPFNFNATLSLYCVQNSVQMPNVPLVYILHRNIYIQMSYIYFLLTN